MEQKFNNKVFLDSGAHGIFNEQVIKKSHKAGYKYYESAEFYQYVDLYAEFIKKNKEYIDIFANVDAIFNPQITWNIQNYIEKKHGIIPIPVIHHGTDLKWLKRYLSKGYKYIALGGLGQEVNQNSYRDWANNAFNIICDTPGNLPSVKVHGFAMTSYYLMTQYPWYSVDSATWIKLGGYGNVIVPPLKGNKWRYDLPFFVINTSSRSEEGVSSSFNSNKKFFQVFKQYVEEKGFPIGMSSIKEVPENYVLKDNEVWAGSVSQKTRKTKVEVLEEEGIINNAALRIQLNGLYFLDLSLNMEPWPWAFKINQNTLL
jgi:hypothetical protein